jgi:putative ABC transport system permease protein
MLLTIAWRNIWRNKRRSLIVLSSVAVGLVAILLNDGLSIGMVRQIFENQIGSHVSHIQIHSTGFNDNKVITNSMTEPANVESVLARTPGIVHYSRRVVTYGLLSSAVNSSGCIIVGVDPGKEQEVTSISRSVVEGTYLTGKPHEVVIGKKLAEKLGVGIGDKVVGMASTMSGSVGADMFRIVGLFQTVSSEFDKSYMFISLPSAQEMLEMDSAVSEFAIITEDRRDAEQIREGLASALGPSYEVLTYADIMPLMISQMRIYEESMYIVYVIVGLAMIFGIVNTMLMSVFERIREFGVLMAIGMKNSRLVGMILLEAAVLGVVGAAVGLLAGVGLLIPLSHSGLDLSMFAESLTSFGTGSIIYPVLRPGAVVESMVIIPLIAVIGAIYPALKAVRFEPVRAIRYV